MIAQRHDFDVGPIEPANRGSVRREQHRLASRQNLRPAMRDFPLRQFRHLGGRAAGGRNPRQDAHCVEAHNDVAVLGPTAAPANAAGGITQGYR
jgi:hypothetical protein